MAAVFQPWLPETVSALLLDVVGEDLCRQYRAIPIDSEGDVLKVAFGDMAYKTFRYENGMHVTDKPFSRPVMLKLKGIDHEVRLVDHEHDEPVTMGLMAEKVLKGVTALDEVVRVAHQDEE